MKDFRIRFDELTWDAGRPGVRMKTFCKDERQVRLVEFETTEGFEQWCEEGHVGFVLDGEMILEFSGGIQTFRAGDGLFIPAGADSKHRAVAIEPGTRLFMVESKG